MLLQRAHNEGWIQHDAFSFGGSCASTATSYTPRAQLEKRFMPDNDTVLLCWQPVLAVVNDLQELLPAAGDDLYSSPDQLTGLEES
jgi:hypothetical protein